MCDTVENIRPMTKNCYFDYFLLITLLFAFAFDSSKPYELNLAIKTLW